MRFLRNFKQEGLSLRVDALNMLKRVLAQQTDEEIRSELIDAIIGDLKNHLKGTTGLCIVTQESLGKTLENIHNEQTRTEEDQAVQVCNAFEFPRLQFNPSKNTFEKIIPDKLNLHGAPNIKIQVMRDRLEAVHRRLLRDPLFQVNDSLLRNNESIKLTTVEELVGSQGPQSILGFLSKIDDEFLYLEDLSGYVKLTIKQNMINEEDNTVIMPAIYSEGMTILAQGQMKGGIFEADLIGTPKVECRENFLNSFPSFHVKSDLPVPPSANIVILSDVWLDRFNVLQKIRKLFEGYCNNRFLPELFILIGNFNSVPLDSLGTNTAAYKEGFMNLSKIMEEFPLLQENSQILLVPGPLDPFDSGILPRRPIASQFTASLEKWKNVTLCSNPCKIYFYSKEILVFRSDMLATIQRLSVFDHSYDAEELHESYVQSILGQGHLSPVPMQASPVYWNLDYTLQLNVLPDLLVLADSCEQFLVQHEGCNVINPSSFNQEFSFASHTPVDGDVSFSVIGDSYAQLESDEECVGYEAHKDISDSLRTETFGAPSNELTESDSEMSANDEDSERSLREGSISPPHSSEIDEDEQMED